MTGTGITREIQDDGSVVLRDARCSFPFRHPPLDELALAIMRDRPLERFVDATNSSMPAIAKHLSETGKLIQIYSDAQPYVNRKAAAI